jgi:hypothetical protein
MRPDEWWRNFGLGLEIDVSGSFIYNGIKLLDEAEMFNHAPDIFEILYNLSVGIERLTKVAIVLIEYTGDVKIEDLEESIITHNTLDLIERLNKHRSLGLSGINKEFIALLSKFYKSYRYARYSLGSVPNIDEEKIQFLVFINKHLNLALDIHDQYALLANTDQIKTFIGRTVRKTVHSVFKVIQQECRRLNIYTDELRGDSKAIKVFYGERLDFIEETKKKKEILLFLMNSKEESRFLKMLRSFKCLDMDSAMTPVYIKALLNDVHLPLVGGEVDELYTEVENIKERFSLLDIMDNEHIYFEDD